MSYLNGVLVLGVVGLGVLALRLVRQRDEARLDLVNVSTALSIQTGQLAARTAVDEHLLLWHQDTQGEHFADSEEVAHSIADWLAQRTGQTIIATQPDGDGLIIAIPDSEATDADA